MSPTPEPAGLYIHVPFCSAVCPYCDFAVQVGPPAVRAGFVDALLAEIALWRDWPHPLDTVYLGGGTPSLLSAEALAAVLTAAREQLPVVNHPRVYLEANPEDVNKTTVRAWKALGVTTLSLGVQSFDAAELRYLGRRHDPEAAHTAVELCIQAGFATVSVDLMFGLPGQRIGVWKNNLETAVGLGAAHISCYQLTVHEGTSFGRRAARGRFTEMPEDHQGALYEATHEQLRAAGFRAYEVSNFARGPEHRSRHNLKYWQHVPYLGLGPSAHAFDGSRRWWNLRELPAYQARIRLHERPIASSETLTTEELASEALMLGLRLADGIDLVGFERRFGVDLVARNRALVRTCIDSGHLRLAHNHLVPTVTGLAVADGLAVRFETTATNGT